MRPGDHSSVGIAATQWPFAPAVAAQTHPRHSQRALAVWEQFVIDLIQCVTTTWHKGTSIDPLEGRCYLIATSGRPTVEVRADAPVTTPEPMHLRGAVHIIENLRPTMRREGDVSIATSTSSHRRNCSMQWTAIHMYSPALAMPMHSSGCVGGTTWCGVHACAKAV